VLLLQAQRREAAMAALSGDAHILVHRLIHRNGGELAAADSCRTCLQPEFKAAAR